MSSDLETTYNQLRICLFLPPILLKCDRKISWKSFMCNHIDMFSCKKRLTTASISRFFPSFFTTDEWVLVGRYISTIYLSNSLIVTSPTNFCVTFFIILTWNINIHTCIKKSICSTVQYNFLSSPHLFCFFQLSRPETCIFKHVLVSFLKLIFCMMRLLPPSQGLGWIYGQKISCSIYLISSVSSLIIFFRERFFQHCSKFSGHRWSMAV